MISPMQYPQDGVGDTVVSVSLARRCIGMIFVSALRSHVFARTLTLASAPDAAGVDADAAAAGADEDAASVNAVVRTFAGGDPPVAPFVGRLGDGLFGGGASVDGGLVWSFFACAPSADGGVTMMTGTWLGR
jgi:hypothetical protein